MRSYLMAARAGTRPCIAAWSSLSGFWVRSTGSQVAREPEERELAAVEVVFLFFVFLRFVFDTMDKVYGKEAAVRGFMRG